MTGLVLVVDDDPDIRDVVCAILEENGYATAEAEGGRAALASLRKGPRPDLILLDLMMPEMNGWDLCEELARDPKLAAIPVVVMSGDSHIEAETTTLTAAGHIAKPFDIPELLGAVRRFTGR